jgi:hypothetical protein
MRAWTSSSVGAGTSTSRASSTGAASSTSVSSGLPASKSISIDVLWSPTFAAPSKRRSTEIFGGLPSRSASKAVSRIMLKTSSRVPGCSAIAPIVARVRTLTGLNATFPSSLSQMSERKSGTTGHFSPPAVIALLNSRQRGETKPEGSPIENRVPSTCRMTPGAEISAEQ